VVPEARAENSCPDRFAIKVLVEGILNSQKAVNSQRISDAIRAIYDQVNLALWAIATVFAFYIAAFVVPKLPQIRANAELQRIAETNAEYEFYCRRLQMGPGTPLHDRCVRDLAEFRTSVETRIADDSAF
jgi:hypothetical protein